ncbi:MAG: hypothetical protein LBT57_00780 [Puniceicoccales bacterium]|jgi:hypothetical protein|nr:hypothetical protein [Puniceicoccales bacterium]
MIFSKKAVSAALGAVSLGGMTLQAWTFGDRELLHMAYSIAYTLALTQEQVDSYSTYLPEQPPKGGQAFDVRALWEKISVAFDSLAKAKLNGSDSDPKSAEELKLYLESEDTVLPAARRELVDYASAFFLSLTQKSGLGAFAKALTTAVWPSVYDREKKKFTTFGTQLYSAYGRSLSAYLNLFHIPTEHKAIIYKVLGIVFNKKEPPSSFTGTSLGWVSEPVETLYFMNVDLRIIHLLAQYGDLRNTYSATLLENLKHFIEMLWVHHLIRFHESLQEFNQAQQPTGDGLPDDSGEEDEEAPLRTDDAR